MTVAMLERGNVLRYTGAHGFKLAICTGLSGRTGTIRVRLWRAACDTWTGQHYVSPEMLVPITDEELVKHDRTIALAIASSDLHSVSVVSAEQSR